MRFNTDLSVYEIDSLPGCSQVAVSHAMFMYPYCRNNGFGGREHEDRLDHIQTLGYDYVICTVEKSNFKQIHILEKNNWMKTGEFTSSRTGHEVCVYGRNM